VRVGARCFLSLFLVLGESQWNEPGDFPEPLTDLGVEFRREGVRLSVPPPRDEEPVVCPLGTVYVSTQLEMPACRLHDLVCALLGATVVVLHRELHDVEVVPLGEYRDRLAVSRVVGFASVGDQLSKEAQWRRGVRTLGHFLSELFQEEVAGVLLGGRHEHLVMQRGEFVFQGYVKGHIILSRC
jgi:hypothetical protein